MGFQMSSEVIFSLEALLAAITVEWPFLRMDDLMLCEIALPKEALITNVTNKISSR